MGSDALKAYCVEHTPAVINFSGGRSSGYMLYHILDYYDGTLPDDTFVLFCNTGKEHEATYRFVRRCAQEWSVPITWLEYRFRSEAKGGRTDPKHDVEVIDFASASRLGEPFGQLIRAKQVLPNVVTRFCTSELKVRTVNRYMRRYLGYKKYTSYLGMRWDEPRRINRALLEACESDYPLYHAQVTEETVNTFWKGHDFDLGISSLMGNCDLCFMKGTHKLIQIMSAEPERVTWWSDQEKEVIRSHQRRGIRQPKMGTFFQHHPYDTLKRVAEDYAEQTVLFGSEDESMDCFCGD